MNWVSYTQDVADGCGRADSNYIKSFMSSLSNDKELKSVNVVMVEFSDKSFIRFERDGK
jgi:hypothetical protein